MIPFFTLLSAHAAESTPLTERRFGVGMTTTFSDSQPVQASGSLRWQASPRWVVEPRFGLRRTAAILDSSPLIQSGTGVQASLSVRRYLVRRIGSVAPVPRTGRAEVFEAPHSLGCVHKIRQ